MYKKLLDKYLPTKLLYALLLIFLTGTFILFIQISRRPDIESVAEFISTLPYYENVQKCEQYNGIYREISDEYDIVVYQLLDGSSCEFAVVDAKNNTNAEIVIEKLKARKNELYNEYANIPDEVKRIDAFKIINVNNLVAFMVYDTNRTAENALHTYFMKLGN